jgi:hypothetical protein
MRFGDRTPGDFDLPFGDRTPGDFDLDFERPSCMALITERR